MKQPLGFPELATIKVWTACGILVIGAVGSSFSQAITSDVFRAQAAFQGVIQTGPTPASQTLQALNLNSDDLVNLALGRDQGTKLQANEVLALAASRTTTNASRLLVYDSSTTSNLATIGRIDPQLAVVGNKFRRNTLDESAEMTVPGAGNAVNGLTVGRLLLDTKSILQTNGATLKFNAKAIGFLGMVVPAAGSSPAVSTNLTVLIRSGTIATQGKAIGTLVEP